MKYVYCSANLFPKYPHFRGEFIWHNAWAAGHSLLGCFVLCLASSAAGAALRHCIQLLLSQFIIGLIFLLEKYVSKFRTSSQLLNHKYVPATKHKQSVHTLHVFSVGRTAFSN